MTSLIGVTQPVANVCQHVPHPYMSYDGAGLLYSTQMIQNPNVIHATGCSPQPAAAVSIKPNCEMCIKSTDGNVFEDLEDNREIYAASLSPFYPNIGNNLLKKEKNVTVSTSNLVGTEEPEMNIDVIVQELMKVNKEDTTGFCKTGSMIDGECKFHGSHIHTLCKI